MTLSRFSSSLLLLIVIFTTAIVACSSKEVECVYTVYVKTGDVSRAGTDSKISFTVSDYTGQSVSVDNLKDWGVMGHGHNYFEKGNVDIFVGVTKCLSSSICKLRLASNGKGILPSWFVESVEVSFTGFQKQCSKAFFPLNRWLSPEKHHELSIEVEKYCFPLPYLSKSAYSNNNNKGRMTMRKEMEERSSIVRKTQPLMSIVNSVQGI